MSTDQRESRRLPVPGGAQTRRMAAAMLLGLAAQALLPFPWYAVALVPLGYGIYEGIGALRAMRDDTTGTSSRIWVAVGLSLLALMTVDVLLPFATFQTSLDRQECLASANTNVARAGCERGLLGQLQIEP